jgi:hypothetical protein
MTLREELSNLSPQELDRIATGQRADATQEARVTAQRILEERYYEPREPYPGAWA